MIWCSAVFICFYEFTGNHSKETTNLCLCWGGDVRTKHGDHSGEMGRNGFGGAKVGRKKGAKRMEAQDWQRSKKREILWSKNYGKN